MKPEITVIIPIYNVEQYLENCIKSVIDQTIGNIEILCIDDCSPDNSYKIVERYAKKDSRIKLIRHEKNLGLGGARNTGIRHAKGEYIASIDSDDRMKPEMLQTLWEQAENGWFDVVCCGFDRVDVSGNILSFQNYPEKVVANENNEINIFSIVNPAFWNKLWRKSLFTDNNIYFPEHDYFEDMATTPRLLAKSTYIKIIKPRLYQYLVRSGSITNAYGPKYIIDYFRGFEIINEFLEKNDLVDRYWNDFVEYVNSGLRFHSETVVSTSLNKIELEKYFRLMLLMKISFFENRDLVKYRNVGELLELLKQRHVSGNFQKKYTQLAGEHAELKKLNLDLNDNLESFQQKLDKQLIKNTELEKNKEELSVLNFELESKLDNQKSFFNEELRLNVEKVNNLSKEIEFSEREKEFAVKEKEKLELASEKLSGSLIELRNEKEDLEAENQFLEKNIEKVRQELGKCESELNKLIKEKKQIIYSGQKLGVLIFLILSWPFLSSRQLKKLRTKPRLFFQDSKNSFTIKIGKWLKII